MWIHFNRKKFILPNLLKRWIKSKNEINQLAMEMNEIFTMQMNEVYRTSELLEFGLVEKEVKELPARVFINGTKVYFFEPINNDDLRLYSIINKRSFFL